MGQGYENLIFDMNGCDGVIKELDVIIAEYENKGFNENSENIPNELKEAYNRKRYFTAVRKGIAISLANDSRFLEVTSRYVTEPINNVDNKPDVFLR